MSDSIWKKEIRLRKPKQEKPAKAAVPVEPARPAKPQEQATPFWKKDLRLGKARELPAPPVVDAPPAASPRPRGTVVVPVVPERSEAVLRLERWSARVPGSRTQFPRSVALPEPVEAPAAPPPVAPLPAPQPVGWQEPEPPAVEAEPTATVAAPEPKQEKVPLLKRELHLRKPKAAKQPKAAKPPKAAKAPKAEKPKKQPKAEQPKKAPKAPRARREIQLTRPSFSLPSLGSLSLPSRGGSGHKVTNVVGLRIGSSQIAAAHVRNNGSAELVQLARGSIERGLVVGGEVREPVALAKALKAFFAANKLPHKDIRLGVASSRLGVRVLDVPAVDDEKQFENAIRFRAQESLPIPVADAVLDHVVLSEETTLDGEVMRRVLLVFAHRELVSRYVDVCRQAGLRLTGIDLDAFGLLRATLPPREHDDHRAAVAVFVGHERTVFAIADGDVCDFTRVLEWGSGAIDVAIARALNLTPSQAGPIKHALDLDATEPPEELSPMQFEAARAAAKAEIGELVRELLASLRFYQSRPGTPDISEIVLSGGGMKLTGFAAEVQRGIGAPIRAGDPFTNVSLGKKLAAPENAESLAIAVGLGIGT